VRLSQIDRGGPFALLGPGFGQGGFTLLRGLEPVTVDHPRARLVFLPYEATAEGRTAQAFDGTAEHAARLELDVPPAVLGAAADPAAFAQAVTSIRERIAAGDVYQVNHTVRCALGPQDPAALLARLCARGVPRFLAWVRLPDGTELVSASPECFFTLDERTLRVEPMKGTAAVGEEATLEASEKDRAELAMITDLMRNDLTPVCVPKSVRVRAARRLIRLPYALQAVSEVEGQLEEGVPLSRVLAALHPAGSVTGAPKHAAMAAISALEASPRGPYCGALVFREQTRATASVLIRTAFREGPGWQFGVGGGITWRSTVEGEWRELLIKLEALR
jgi:anthranilate/para-aminobenzoate synthase component I